MKTKHTFKKEIDHSSLEVDGIEHWDAPEFCDAYICGGCYEDGEPITEEDLDKLNDDQDLVHELVYKHLY